MEPEAFSNHVAFRASKLISWFIGIIIFLAIAYAVVMLVYFVFISQITQIQVSYSSKYKVLADGVSVTEMHTDLLPSHEHPNTGDMKSGREMLLRDDGYIEEGQRVFDDDPRLAVLVSSNPVRHDAFVVVDNEVYEYATGYKGNRLHDLTEKGISYVSYVLPINAKYMLLEGDTPGSSSAEETMLWQVDYAGFNKTLLTNDPYFSFIRPSKVFVFKETNEQVVVYYIGSYDFAFGGDASRPVWSVIRIYNSQHPEGWNIAKFGYRAGTVLQVDKVTDGYIVTADPSLPAMTEKPRLPPTQWKIAVR